MRAHAAVVFGMRSLEPWTRRRVAVLGLALAACATAFVASCTRAPSLACDDATACDKSATCILARCRRSADPVFTPASRRIVLSPVDVALLSSKHSDVLTDGEVAFGRAALGDVVVLLSFDAGASDAVDVDAAYLTLYSSSHAPRGEGPFGVSIASISSPWHASALSWARQPPLGVPESVPDAHVGERVLRIDVTDLYRASRGLPNGIAVLASGGDPLGATYDVGLGTGTAPALELYLIARTSPGDPPSVSAAPSALPSAVASASSGATPTTAPPRKPPPKRPRPRP